VFDQMEGKCVSAASANDNNRSGWPEAILFDLDGTLIDSVPDIAAAVNELLTGDGLQVVSVDAVRGMIGNGVKKLVERAYASVGKPHEGDALNAATDRMMGIYGKHLTRHTVAMPGALDLIASYHECGREDRGGYQQAGSFYPRDPQAFRHRPSRWMWWSAATPGRRASPSPTCCITR
jgi:beta-phosphoglucomutase-like phosphatase (HAD superfamily)